jgi:hypothetical protein
MKIELSKQDAAIIQFALVLNTKMLKNAIRMTSVHEAQISYAKTINAIRELQSRIERAQ